MLAVTALFNNEVMYDQCMDWIKHCFHADKLSLQQVNRLEITPDKRFLAAAGNSHIRLFDVNSNSPQPVCYMFSKVKAINMGQHVSVPYLIKINLTGN